MLMSTAQEREETEEWVVELAGVVVRRFKQNYRTLMIRGQEN